MDLKQFTQAIQQIADEKGIAKEKIMETIELALSAAYKRDYGKKGQIVRATLDPTSGKATMRQIKIAVDETMIKTEEEVKVEEEERMKKLGASGVDEPPAHLERRGWQEPHPNKPRRSASKEGESPEKTGGEKDEMAEETEDEAEKRVRFNPEKHIMLEEAKKTNPDVKPGDELEFPLEFHDEFGRIAAQTAKQVIMQRIREIEREAVFEEYKNKEGELTSGIIQRIEGRSVFIDIGRTIGILPPEEQIPYERYNSGTRIKTLITLVEKNPKGPGVFLSRSHPRLLRKLFEIEVPEIAAGTVEIKAIAREPGSRSKVAVVSHEGGVDPVGSLVGQKGIRVTTVINELGGEKIDVIAWSEDPAEFVANSLSPAKVFEVEISDKYREARAIVPEEQLSLAIGKGGQNVRLAAKLTGWKIDVRSSKKQAEETPEETEQEKEKPAEISTEAQKELKEVIKEAVEAKEVLAESSSTSADAKALADKKASEDKEKPTEEKKPKKSKKKKSKDEGQKTKDEN